ncbi:unnamed protein product [Lathyrus oleraceus]|uniref:Pectinesterase inhibitor domain-containing protein n=1 Tax=Pisum sativum TaxID=3888 RepID=A0A9D5GWB9_PEA|nr:hypothetical protein KIW84_012256 [Pisum sativum]
MNHYSFSLLVILLLCVASCNSTKVVEVNVICKEAFKPSFCSKLLNSKSGGAKGADLVNLAQYTIDVLSVNLTNTVNLINKLISEGGGKAKARKHYDTCLLDLGPYGTSASVHLIDADFSLKRREYREMAASTALLMQNILHCKNDRKDYYYDDYHSDKSLLSKYVDVIMKTGQVLDIISKYLNLG